VILQVLVALFLIGFILNLPFGRFIDVGAQELINGMQNLKIAVNNSTDIKDVYEVWQQQNNIQKTTDVYIKMSHDGGKNFTQQAKLSNYKMQDPTMIPKTSYNPEISSSGKLVVAVWQAILPGSNISHIFTTNSTDAGNTFTAPIDITNSSLQVGAIEPHVIIDQKGKVLISYLGDFGPENPCKRHC
jgi:hypothetical protein